jgi:hypothetical protein
MRPTNIPFIGEFVLEAGPPSPRGIGADRALNTHDFVIRFEQQAQLAALDAPDFQLVW